MNHRAPLHDPVPLLVMHPDPAALAVRIRPHARPRLTLVTPTRHDSIGVDLGSDRVEGLRWDDRNDVAIVRFPLDGPTATIAAALGGLRARLRGGPNPWVLLQNTDGHPPPRTLLELVRGHGLRPGVDLSSIDWVKPDSILWSDGQAACTVAVGSRQRTPIGSATSVLHALRGFDPDTALAGSLEQNAHRGTAMSDANWTLGLQAHYIEGTALPMDPPRAVAHA